jgi:mannose-6-phosphate isomerase
VPDNGRFPLLLKFLDTQAALSVQVHPNDEQAAMHQAKGQGKTEAWVILRAEPGAQIYAGLVAATDRLALERAVQEKRVPEVLHAVEPTAGDCIFLPAGTVHAIGAGLLLFEIQQTSDITFRLYDWDRVDAKTGQARPLHVEDSLRCIDYQQGPVFSVLPIHESQIRERLFVNKYFRVWRIHSNRSFRAGLTGECRILILLSGKLELQYRHEPFPLSSGQVLLLPAEVGACNCIPAGDVELLEVGLGE